MEKERQKEAERQKKSAQAQRLQTVSSREGVEREKEIYTMDRKSGIKR
jgi:hypothetical protein